MAEQNGNTQVMERVTDEQYREAARRLYAGGTLRQVSHWAGVRRVGPPDGGAYVEMEVWVPDAEAAGR